MIDIVNSVRATGSDRLPADVANAADGVASAKKWFHQRTTRTVAIGKHAKAALASAAMLLAVAWGSTCAADSGERGEWVESGVESIRVLTPVVVIPGSATLALGKVPGTDETHDETVQPDRVSMLILCGWCCPPHICGFNGPDMTGISDKIGEDAPPAHGDGRPRGGWGGPIGFNGPDLVGLPVQAQEDTGQDIHLKNYPGGWGGGIGFNGPDMNGIPEALESPHVSRGIISSNPCPWCCPPSICGYNGPDLTGTQAVRN